MTDKPQSSKEEEEKSEPMQFAKWVFRTLYSPIKAFEEIVKKPSIKGPILILLITLPLTFAGQYASGVKFFLEIPTPEDDFWTEKPTGSAVFSWNSNGNLSFDNGDSVVGNYSVSTLFTSSSPTWIQLTNIGSFNCSKEEYSRLFFRIKLVNAANTTPTEAKLQLSSFNNESRAFDIDVMSSLIDIADDWANVSVDLATEEWTATNLPSWANITGVRLQLTWAESATLFLKIDDLFFGKFNPVTSSSSLALQGTYWLMRNVFDFLLRWLILSVIVFLALKSLSEWKGFWKDMLSILGYVFSVLIVYQIALALTFLVLPPLYIPYNISYTKYLDIYQSSWGLPISVLGLLQYGWTTILCAIAVRKMVLELSWNKAFLVGFGAVIMSLILGSILLSAFF